jgi:Domain of unknown function (DUF1707)
MTERDEGPRTGRGHLRAADAERDEGPGTGRGHLRAANAERDEGPGTGRGHLRAANAERDEGPGTGRGHLRAANADRERVVSALQAAFVQGRLDKDELDARVGQAFASRTYAELAALTADLPAAPALDPTAAGPVSATLSGQPARTLARAATRSVICLLITIALVEGAFLTQSLGLLTLAAFGLMGTSGFLGYGVVDAYQERRDLRRSPGAGHRVAS